jgi:anti-sigma-K factor RskA
MTHQEAYEKLESFAFETLETDEAAGVEAHLQSGCEECIERYRELAELSARLASTVPQRIPPQRIRENLFEKIRETRFEGRTSSNRSRYNIGWMTAAIAAVVAVFLLVQTSRLRDQVARRGDDLIQMDEEIASLNKELLEKSEELSVLEQNLADSRDDNVALLHDMEGRQEEMSSLHRDLATRQEELETLQRDLAAYEDATVLLGQPGMQFVDLSGVEPNAQAFGKVVIDPNRGTGIVYMYRLPQAPEGMEYQLWVMREGKPTSVGTFTVADDGSGMLSMNAVPDPTEIASFEVTIEPAGGMPEPTGMMYLTGPDLP